MEGVEVSGGAERWRTEGEQPFLSLAISRQHRSNSTDDFDLSLSLSLALSLALSSASFDNPP